MEFIGDFHIHSKYSRATSPQTDLENLERFAGIKGITVLGTGDFTHPGWLKNLKTKLNPAERGLFKIKESLSPVRFILTSEISCIYKKAGKVRKIHIIVFAPSFEVVDKINFELEKIGNLKSDGRPILGLDVKDLAKIVLDADENCMVVPAHAWTPWFAIFGSKSGFDSIEECFDDYSKYVYAIETGLSSDPKMNWQLSQLDNIAFISNSDAHSPQKIGREANVFDTDLNYFAIRDAIKEKDPKKFLYTIEFFPEEGKYHYDGHRLCNISFSPEQSKKHNNICPKCGTPLVIGVLNRVAELADREYGFKPKNAIPYKSLIPLEEIIAEALGVSTASKQVPKYYDALINNLGNECKILLQSSYNEISQASLPEIAEAITKVRDGKVVIEPGYDGVYGKIKIFDGLKKNKFYTQKTLL